MNRRISLWFWSLVFIVFWTPASYANDVDSFNYKACNGPVPIREYPGPMAQRRGTIPEDAVVRSDMQQGKWVRVIYKIPAGFYIGWSLKALLCPIER